MVAFLLGRMSVRAAELGSQGPPAMLSRWTAASPRQRRPVGSFTVVPQRSAEASRTWPTRASWWAVGVLTALAAVLRFYHLGHQGFWFDEANTALLVGFSPGKMLGLIPQTESTPPLYYMAAWVWARVFGSTEPGLRSLSALAGVLVVPVVYGASAKLVSRRAGVITAALAACSPLLIWY